MSYLFAETSCVSAHHNDNAEPSELATEPVTDQIVNLEVEEAIPQCSVMAKTYSKAKRLKWSAEQNHLLRCFFKKHLIQKIPVRQEDAKKFLCRHPDMFAGLNWRHIKNKIWNDSKSKSVLKNICDATK